jgi:hypothetical protein
MKAVTMRTGWIRHRGMVLSAIVLVAAIGSAASGAAGERAMSARSVRAAQDLLLDQLLAGVVDSRIVAARVGDAPPITEVSGATWLHFEIETRSEAEYLRGYWQANVVAGLFRQLSLEQSLPDLRGRSYVRLWPDGREEPYGDTAIDIEPQPAGRAIPAATLQADLTDAAEHAGLSVDQVLVSQPAGYAVAEVIGRTRDPKVFVGSMNAATAQLFGAAFGDVDGPPRVEGIYLEVRDTAGELVYVAASAPRVGAAATHLNPKYREFAPDASRWR